MLFSVLYWLDVQSAHISKCAISSHMKSYFFTHDSRVGFSVLFSIILCRMQIIHISIIYSACSIWSNKYGLLNGILLICRMLQYVLLSTHKWCSSDQGSAAESVSLLA